MAARLSGSLLQVQSSPAAMAPTVAFVASSGSGLDGLAGWVLDVIAAIGAVGVGALVLLETVFPPVPSEVVLPLAGFHSGRESLSFTAVLVSATVGSVTGALFLYWCGVALGKERLCRITDRIPLLNADDVDRAHAWFARHGRSAVLFGRLVPGVRSLISVPAGTSRMPLPQFVLYTALGSGLYNFLLVLLGHQLGSRWTTVAEYSDWVNYTFYVLITAGIGWLLLRRTRRRRRVERAT